MANAVNVFGGATGNIYGYEAHFVGSGGTDTYANAISSSTPCSMATAMSNVTDGHVILIMDDGQYDITTNQTPTDTSGSFSSGFIVFAGTGNQNGADNNGGRPIVDAGSNAIDAMGAGTGIGVWWENIQIQNAGNTGLKVHADGIAYNIVSNSNSNGIQLTNRSLAIFCRASNNTGEGIYASGTGSKVMFCLADGNSTSGIRMGSIADALHNVCYNNSTYGILANSSAAFVALNTCDESTNGISTGSGGLSWLLFNQITNVTNGITGTRDISILALSNNFFGNTSDVDAGMIEVDSMSSDPLYINLADRDYRVGDNSDSRNIEVITPLVVNPVLDIGGVQRSDFSGDASDYAENQILDYVLRDETDWAPTTIYIALFASSPHDDQTYFGEELFGDGYARQTITFRRSNDGVIKNNAAVTFPVATPSYWTTVTHFALFDALTEGHMLFAGKFDSSLDVAEDDQLQIDADGLSIQLR